MNPVLGLVVLLSVIAAVKGTCNTQTFNGGSFPSCQSLSKVYDLYWKIDGDNITLGLHVSAGFTNGWVGLGTSVGGGMRGADIAVAQAPDGKNYVLQDRFVPYAEGTPKLDDHQDLNLISASSDDSGTITVIFQRKLIPCDISEDVPIQLDGLGGTPIIFAYGQTFGYHGQNRGSAVVYFNGAPAQKSLPSDTQVVQVTIPAYTIPATETTYACTPVELPSNNKTHIVRWRPIITPGNEALVHHMVIFVCPTKPASSEPYECGMAPSGCSTIMFAWSLGQPGSDWLDDYAMPMGTGGATYIVLQMHYNNPTLKAGALDNSGIALYYTKQLRKYDMGAFLINTGMSRINVPALAPSYTQSAECPSECTSKISTPFTIVNYLPHMHEIGQKIWTQHIRGNQELPEIFRDNHYDFQRQQSYPMNVKVQPGDRIILHCDWKSNRNVATIGGEDTSKEMCVGIFLYYPLFTNWVSCSDSGSGNAAICKSRTPMAQYTYNALPEPHNTCADSPIQPNATTPSSQTTSPSTMESSPAARLMVAPLLAVVIALVFLL